MEEQGPTRIFQTKPFARLAKAESIDVTGLIGCVTEAEAGLIEADFGRGIIKQRLARSGQGKAGSFRTVLVFRSGKRAIFLYLFAKNDQANISQKELRGYQKLAGIYLKMPDEQIEKALSSGQLIEIKRGEEKHHGKEASQRPASRHSRDCTGPARSRAYQSPDHARIR